VDTRNVSRIGGTDPDAMVPGELDAWFMVIAPPIEHDAPECPYPRHQGPLYHRRAADSFANELAATDTTQRHGRVA